MQSKRTIFLTGVLIVLSLGYVGQITWEKNVRPWMYPAPDSKPLPGENSLSNIEISRNERGQWFASFDYFFTGDPASLSVTVETLGGSDPLKPQVLPQSSPYFPAQRGKQHVTQELKRPSVSEAVSVTQVRVRLIQWHPKVKDIVTRSTAVQINWPDYATAMIHDELRTKPAEDFLRATVDLIDAGRASGLVSARQRLELLLEKHPQFHQAYLELARVAMKTNRGPEGLRQSETYVDAARKLAPDDPNVWIFQAYVYTHQGRYKEAEPLFIAASKTNTSNLWLWTDWGEFHLFQGETKQAIEMFHTAIERPTSGNADDRARKHAYWHIFKLLETQNSLDLMETLYEKRHAEYSSVACYGAEFAQFILMKRGNVARAIELASQPIIATCEEPNSKELLGLSYYARWIEAPTIEKSDILNRARVFFPSGTRLIYQLASSDYTAKALKALQRAGEPVDQMDNRKMTALAYALSNKDHDTARRLLRLQARSNLVIGPSEIPLSLIPVLAEDYPGIKLLRQSGVDYSKVKFQGMTAIDHAKSINNRKLLEALGGHQGQRL